MSLKQPSRKVRSDNGSEFKNTRVDDLCDEFGIRHQFLAKYTPQSNGLVERKNRTLIDMARSMLSEYNVTFFLGQNNQHDLLLSMGFMIGKVDTTLFTKKIGKELFVMQIYVDDIIFGSTNQDL